jgi:hypothetical protein
MFWSGAVRHGNSSLTSEEFFWGWTLDERGRLGSGLLAGPCGMAVSGDPGGILYRGQIIGNG